MPLLLVIPVVLRSWCGMPQPFATLPDPQASCAWSCRLILKPIASGTLGRVEISKVQADVDAKKTDTLFPSVDASVVYEGDVTSDWTEEVEEDMTGT